jgi:RNA polymerase sigma-70 factor (ECF subfamily)
MAALTLHEQVVQTYLDARDDVYYYLLTLGVGPAEAQDIAQDTFLRLYVTLQKGDAIQNHRAWVFRVAHNLGLNARTRRRETVPADEIRTLDAGTDPEARAIAADRDARLRSALEELSPQQRQCLHLRAEGLRYHEIASVLGVTTSTVNEFVRRGISKLKKVLA